MKENGTKDGERRKRNTSEDVEKKGYCRTCLGKNAEGHCQPDTNPAGKKHDIESNVCAQKSSGLRLPSAFIGH